MDWGSVKCTNPVAYRKWRLSWTKGGLPQTNRRFRSIKRCSTPEQKRLRSRKRATGKRKCRVRWNLRTCKNFVPIEIVLFMPCGPSPESTDRFTWMVHGLSRQQNVHTHGFIPIRPKNRETVNKLSDQHLESALLLKFSLAPLNKIIQLQVREN